MSLCNWKTENHWVGSCWQTNCHTDRHKMQKYDKGYHQQHIRWMKIWVLLLGGVKWSLPKQIVFVYQLNGRWLSALQSISREIWCSIVELVRCIWCIILHTTVKCQNNNCNNFHWEEKIQENLVLNTEVQFEYFQGTKYQDTVSEYVLWNLHHIEWDPMNAFWWIIHSPELPNSKYE